jgi:hypothetical protein
MNWRTSIVGAVILGALVACGAPSATGSDSASGGSASSAPSLAIGSASPDLTADWQRIVISEHGFALQLPPTWESVDLTSEDLSALTDDLATRFPDLPAAIAGMLQSGGALFAFDGDQSHSVPGFGTNLNVIVEDIPATATLDDVIQANRDGIVQALHPDTPVDVELIDHTAGQAALVTYEITAPGDISVQQTQLYLVSDGTAYYVTVSRPTSLTELQDTTLAIFETFELLP